jgi:hypothetical protein
LGGVMGVLDGCSTVLSGFRPIVCSGVFLLGNDRYWQKCVK